MLFENIACKLAFFELLAQESDSLIVVDCGSGSSQRLGLNNALIIQANGYESVLKSLEDILGNRNEEANKCVLNTLIIENISAFYWELRESKRRHWLYSKLAEVLRSFQQTYKCNVVVTSWDNDFEKGYNYKPMEKEPRVLQDLTFIPGELVLSADRVFAIGKQVLEFHGTWHGQ